jgi:hypothetical protein
MLLTWNCRYLSQASVAFDETGSHQKPTSAIVIFPKIRNIQTRHCKAAILVNEKVLKFPITFQHLRMSQTVQHNCCSVQSI